MDWQGQKLVEQLMQILLVCFAVVAFVVGYVLGSFQTMRLIYAGGVVFTTLLTAPGWPFFNRRPLSWLEPSEAEKHPKPEPVTSISKKKSTKKWVIWLTLKSSHLDVIICLFDVLDTCYSVPLVELRKKQ
ncbi:hypothetical protein Leryth_016338 [Lithospermum erythrorhizon]|uniref:Signal peptidase complex subunit 1 n=1 Tax=Lithospermum erythrorhizon TaxID=34254 RepID=A0AAV3NP60_LITER|nr:hypothetical protein Leryth_016338 [Lithospermum erythrorhizon]